MKLIKSDYKNNGYSLCDYLEYYANVFMYIASHCDVMSLSFLCAFVALNKKITYLLILILISVLMCSSIVYANFQCTWMKDGKMLRAGDRFEIVYTLGICSLEVAACDTSDAGKYTCIAENSQGTEESTCKVTVNGRLQLASFNIVTHFEAWLGHTWGNVGAVSGDALVSGDQRVVMLCGCFGGRQVWLVFGDR